MEFRGRGFWAFDVVSGVFLKHLVDAANQLPRLPENGWVGDAVAMWKVNAAVAGGAPLGMPAPEAGSGESGYSTGGTTNVFWMVSF